MHLTINLRKALQGERAVFLPLPFEEFSLTQRSKHLSDFSHPLPARNALSQAEQICRPVGWRWAEPGRTQWLLLEWTGRAGRSPGCVLPRRCCRCLTRARPQKCGWDCEHRTFQESGWGRAEMSVLLQIIHSWLLHLTLRSRKDFLSGLSAAKSYDLKKFLESFQKEPEG